MPARPCRVEDYGRAARFAARRALRERNRERERDVINANASSSSDSNDSDGDVDQVGSNSDASVDLDEAPAAAPYGGNPPGIIAAHDNDSNPSGEEAESEGTEGSDTGPSDDSDQDEMNDLEQDDEGVPSDGDASAESGPEVDEELAGAGMEIDEQNSSDSEEEAPRNDGNEQLYPGSPLTVAESMQMVLTFALNHSLTGKCIADLLQLLSAHCIQPNNCKTSLHNFKKFFSHMNVPITRHYYCSLCMRPLIHGDECNNCPENTQKSYFITMSLIVQLRTMLKRNNFYPKLRHRWERVKDHEDNYEDIYDGALYKEQSREGGFLSDPNAISFCWNADGIPVFKSSKFSIWPFFLRINELSYQDRVRKDNILLGGLWFGPVKPNPNLFLLPLLPELTQLGAGIQVRVPQLENPVTIRAMVLCGTCDMPAKAAFLCLNLYNGYFGCTVCKQRGERLPDNRQVYRYQEDFNMRTDEETENFAAIAQRVGEPVLGVKGFSILSRIVPGMITSTAIDPMHKFSGIAKKLLQLWFDSNFSERPFSLSHFKPLVERRLLDIKPPGFVERLPRSIFLHLKYLKISELKNLLFHYLIPILHDLMLPIYFNHFKLLVSGLHKLNQRSISPEDINLASQTLTEFVVQFEDLYGLEHMSCNIHQLLHLDSTVRNLGPLWTVSCAPFESMNGTLKQYIHGTRFADLQVCTGASLYLGLSVLKERFLRQNGPVQMFCERLSNRAKRLRLERITEKVSAADKLHRLQPVPGVIQHLLNRINVRAENIYVFKRAFMCKQLFVAESYTRARRTNSNCVKFWHNGNQCFGVIQRLMRVSNCACNFVCNCVAKCYAIIQKYETQNTFSTVAPRTVLSFIHESRIGNDILVVEVENFIGLCFFVSVADINKIFIVEPVNSMETDD